MLLNRYALVTTDRLSLVPCQQCLRKEHYELLSAHSAVQRQDIQGVPGGMCQTSGECSLS